MNILVLNTLSEITFARFFPKDVQDRLDRLGNVTYLEYTNSSENVTLLKEQIQNVDVMFTGWGASALHSGFDREFYDAAKRLRIIAHTGGSVADLVNEEMRQRRDFVLLSGNRYYAESVAQGTICYMLMAQRRLYPILKETEKSGWCPAVYTAGLRGKTVGLMSFGMITKHVARMLQVFDCKVKVYSAHGVSAQEQEEYHVTPCSLEELFSTCDIVSIHSGLTDKTYHCVNERLLGMMKDDALLVNTSRGAVIDEAALEKEVRTGRIRAVLDVMEVEPLPMESGLRGLDNVILVPHRGGPTLDLYPIITHALIDDVERYFNGNTQLENQITMAYARNMTSHAIVQQGADESGKK